MLDDRKAFEKGFILNFQGERDYVIMEEIGRGGSCLVYGAAYMDAAGCSHQVRIKECFPYWIGVQRQDGGALVARDSDKAALRKQKKNFVRLIRIRPA